MSSPPPWDYSGGPKGQPRPLAPGEYISPAPRPLLFGKGYRTLVGQPIVISVNQPAAGAEWTYTHGGPSWFFMRSIVATLATSAVVATRVARLQLKYKGVLCGQHAPSATQAASLTEVYTAGAQFSATADTTTNPWNTPVEFIVCDGMTLSSSTLLKDVGDQWSAIAILGEEYTDAVL
jgi:hypothetical protein